MAEAAGATSLILKPPPPLSFKGNIAENWKKWIRKFENYLDATETDGKADKIKVAVLIHAIGEEAVEKYETFDLTDEERKVYASVKKAFEDYCVPKTNESINRHLFFQRRQKKDESFDVFLTELKKLSLDCNFDTLKDGLLRDQIIAGIRDTKLKERLLREDDWTLDRCVKMCKSAELAEQQLKTLQNEPKTASNVQQKKAAPKNRETGNGPPIQKSPQNQQRQQAAQGSGQKQKFQQPRSNEGEGQRKNLQQSKSGKDNQKHENNGGAPCRKCGLKHPYGKCPAHNVACNLCKNMGHTAQVCTKANQASKQ